MRILLIILLSSITCVGFSQVTEKPKYRSFRIQANTSYHSQYGFLAGLSLNKQLSQRIELSVGGQFNASTIRTHLGVRYRLIQSGRFSLWTGIDLFYTKEKYFIESSTYNHHLSVSPYLEMQYKINPRTVLSFGARASHSRGRSPSFELYLGVSIWLGKRRRKSRPILY